MKEAAQWPINPLRAGGKEYFWAGHSMRAVFGDFPEQWIDPDTIYIYIYIYIQSVIHANPEQQSLKVKSVKLHRFVELKSLISPW